ncbi:hypothetical protein GCM10023318_61870 [Nocardia callitridis]|uniref:Uncharacterized protein n=1 Tax=Nocardia callitridis TaxID=648753 RepID=A0ABP9L719_9NOCA
MPETISGPYVVRWMLMGGTLTGFSEVSVGPEWLIVWGYIDTLLGPERTRECFF